MWREVERERCRELGGRRERDMQDGITIEKGGLVEGRSNVIVQE